MPHKRKKKVLFIVNSLSLGGAEKVLSLLANTFHHKAIFDVEIVLLEDIRTYHTAEDIKVTALSPAVHTHALQKLLMLPLDALRLARYIRRNSPDIVVSFIFRADFVNLLASRLTGIPVIVSTRVNVSSTYSQKSAGAAINKFLIRKLYPKADAIINVSQGIQKDLTQNFQVPLQKQSVIYNPYDIRKIERLAEKPLHEVPAFPKERTFIIVSRLRPVKNNEIILEIFATLPEDTRLLIVGDGPHEKHLKALAERLQLDKRVIFTGPKENPFVFMKQAAIYLSASDSEGFPNALVEAMICGCAVISTDCPSGPREILAPQTPFDDLCKEGFEETPYGILVAMQDREAYREAMLLMLEDQQKREALIRAGKKRASAFELDHIVTQYAEKISEVAV